MRRLLLLAVTLMLGAACGPTIGDACTSAADCGGAVCLTRDFTPGGSCSTSCMLETPTNSCPTGSTCVKDALGQGTAGCMRTCNPHMTCRTGYQCKSANGSETVCIGPKGI